MHAKGISEFFAKDHFNQTCRVAFGFEYVFKMLSSGGFERAHDLFLTTKIIRSNSFPKLKILVAKKLGSAAQNTAISIINFVKRTQNYIVNFRIGCKI